MGFVESILCKIHHVVIDPGGHLLGNTVCHASGHPFFLISINKVSPLFLHHCLLFLAHGTAHQIAPPKSVAAKIPDDLHYLLLIYNTAIGRRQNRL